MTEPDPSLDVIDPANFTKTPIEVSMMSHIASFDILFLVSYLQATEVLEVNGWCPVFERDAMGGGSGDGSACCTSTMDGLLKL